MADSAAWFALIGAVGGAVVGAGGAVLGPLMLHRRQAAERREALLRQEERERAQQRREDELLERQQQFESRVAERERATAAQREQAAELAARQTAVTDRLKNMRSTTRAWQLLLNDTLKELWHGRPVDPGAFSEACRAARKAVNEAFDEALHDGLWFAHAGSARTLMRDGSMMQALRRNDHGVDVHALGQALGDATSALSACVEAGCPLPEDLLLEASSQLRHLDLARESLAAYTVGRLVALGVEVERPPSA